MNKDLQLICFVAAVAVATFLIGAGEYVMGVVVILAALILTTAAQMFEHRVNAKAWERSDNADIDDED